MSPCDIKPGYKFLVYASGFEQGDDIVLKDGSAEYALDTQIFDGYAGHIPERYDISIIWQYYAKGAKTFDKLNLRK